MKKIRQPRPGTIARSGLYAHDELFFDWWVECLYKYQEQRMYELRFYISEPIGDSQP